MATRSGVTSPTMRTASPGPGKGCGSAPRIPRAAPVARIPPLYGSRSASEARRFVLSHQPGVDVDREESIAERATREDRRGRAVDTARAGDNRLARYRLPDRPDLFRDERLRIEHHSLSVRESSTTHFFNASR